MSHKMNYLDCAQEMLGHALIELQEYIEEVVEPTQQFITCCLAYHDAPIVTSEELDEYFCKLLLARENPIRYIEKANRILGKYYLDSKNRAQPHVVRKKLKPTASKLLDDFVKVQSIYFQLTEYYEPLNSLITMYRDDFPNTEVESFAVF